MLLKWILNALAVVLLLRLFRRWLAPKGRPERTGAPGLDPERAVPARWSEEEEDRSG